MSITKEIEHLFAGKCQLKWCFASEWIERSVSFDNQQNFAFRSFNRSDDSQTFCRVDRANAFFLKHTPASFPLIIEK